MTAKEMFEKLYFIKLTSDCYNEKHIRYEALANFGADIISIEFVDGYFVYTTLHRLPMKTSGDILKAIYKQMEELGWL